MVCDGRFPPASTFGLPGTRLKFCAAVVQQKAQALHRDARAEIVVQALDPTGDVAVLVDRREIGGLAEHRRTGRHRAVGLRRIDRRRPLARVIFRQKPAHRDVRESRIAVVPQIGIRQLHGFDPPVQFVTGRIRTVLAGRLGFHDVQHLERGDPLAVGRQFVHAPSAVVRSKSAPPTRRRMRQDPRPSWCRPNSSRS